jgi:hypothetical protein
VRKLNDMSSCSNLVRFVNEIGKFLSSLLKDRSNVVSFIKNPDSRGIEPSILLLEMSRIGTLIF